MTSDSSTPNTVPQDLDPGEGEATVRIYLTKELRHKFRLACLTQEESMASVLRRFMLRFSSKNS